MRHGESFPRSEKGADESQSLEQSEAVFDPSTVERSIDDAQREFDADRKLSAETRQRLREEVDACAGVLTKDENPENVRAAAKLLARIHAHPGLAERNPVEKKLRTLFLKMDWDDWGRAPAEMPWWDEDRAQWKATRGVDSFFREIFGSYGLNTEHMVAAWRQSIFPEWDKGDHNLNVREQQDLVCRNLATLRALEQERPGAAAALADEFGVMCFGRYPVKLLVDQYDNKDDLEHPYGTVITAKHDYNGFTYSERENPILSDLFDGIHEKYHIRVVEAGRQFGIARSLVGLDRRYGERQKISFAIVRAHGDETGIALGRNRGRAEVTLYDLYRGEGIERIKEFFAPHATVIIDSCLTGTQGGFAQEVFQTFDVRVVAFDHETTGIDSIGVDMGTDTIDFEVKFGTGEKGALGSMNARTYG